ncbi:hypothetical protein Bca52824_008275 [Brassica carinata]|uniref:Uncharacterized protein n=1 Tax=Brassica carinata TaxID=52824 RepID=A0A8X7W9X1_BRACI|nr:hypothetical protein Bca52824_008275 [Brassica carinata]
MGGKETDNGVHRNREVEGEFLHHSITHHEREKKSSLCVSIPKKKKKKKRITSIRASPFWCFLFREFVFF